MQDQKDSGNKQNITTGGRNGELCARCYHLGIKTITITTEKGEKKQVDMDVCRRLPPTFRNEKVAWPVIDPNVDYCGEYE